MQNEKLAALNKIFASYPNIKLVYLFGSRASGQAGPLSDYDFAVYLDGTDAEASTNLKLDLFAKLSRELATDKIDILLLNVSQSPELKFNAVKNGRLIFEREPFRVLIEPRVFNEYFDFRALLLRHGLIKAL